MKIENIIADKPQNTSSRSKAAPAASSSFLDSLSTQLKSEGITQTNSSASTAGAVSDPVKIYEEMTARTVEPQRSSKEALGVTWDDKKLAGFAALDYGGVVDISKKAVNWNATGEQTLSQEQIAELRGRYNLNNLSAQGYYDLMADLTNMNVISAEDIAHIYLTPLPTKGNGFRLVDDTPIEYGRPRSGNIFENIMSQLDFISNRCEFLLSDDFWKLNPHCEHDAWKDYFDRLNEKADSLSKINDILSSIRG